MGTPRSGKAMTGGSHGKIDPAWSDAEEAIRIDCLAGARRKA